MQTCRMREPLKRKEPGHIDEIQPLEREHKMVVNIIHKWVGIFFEGIFLVSCTYIKWISFSLISFFCQGYLNLAVPDLHNYFKNLLKGLRI